MVGKKVERKAAAMVGRMVEKKAVKMADCWVVLWAL
jgi:hypothetical protein